MRNEHNPKPAAKMDRTEIIYELSRHAHPMQYHKIIHMPTEPMRRLLAWYRSSKKNDMIRGYQPIGIYLDEATGHDEKGTVIARKVFNPPLSVKNGGVVEIELNFPLPK